MKDSKVAERIKSSIPWGWLFLILVLSVAAAAPTYRLRNLERAPGPGFNITSTTDGKAQWSASSNGELDVNLVPINYQPPASGNTQNLNEAVIDPGGNVWFIDSDGDAVQLTFPSSSDPEANDIFYDDENSGLGDDVAAALDSLARREFNVTTVSSGTVSYRVNNTDIIYTGDASDTPVTYSVVQAGELTFTIPAGVISFTVTIPKNTIGLGASNATLCRFNFPNDSPYNQSEETMRYPSAQIFSRATETSNGFDVELVGNNPQSRLMPFVASGRCEHQFAGVNTAGNSWTIIYRF